MALRCFNELFEILIMRVAIYGRKIKKQTIPAFNEVFETILSFGWSILLEEDLSVSLKQKTSVAFAFETFANPSDLGSNVDLMISIGGDGTFLKSVDYIRDSEIPIVGINTGRLGFLANVSREHIQEALALVRDNKYVFQKRSLLTVSLDGGKDEKCLDPFRTTRAHRYWHCSCCYCVNSCMCSSTSLWIPKWVNTRLRKTF